MNIIYRENDYMKIIVAMLLVFAHVCAYGESAPNELSLKIEKIRQKMHIPGASIAVIDKGKIRWAKGFGYADLKMHRKVTKNTLFQAASITKTLTAAAALKLFQEKSIALDEPVNRYLKRWQIPENKFTQKVSVSFRLLLNHTAAISNPYPDGGYGPKNTLPTLTQVFNGKFPATNPPLHVTRIPGTKYEYCNGCYSVLQGAMEDISHLTYPELMKTSILLPAKMRSSRFDNEFFLSDTTQIALPYNPELKRYANAPTRSPIYATGLLWTTAKDLAKYNIAIAQALKKDNKLISKKLATELITPSHTPIHGLGFFIGNKYGEETACGHYIFHAGANIGYLSLSLISQDGQQGAVVLINVSPKWDAKDYPQFKFVKQTVKMIGDYYHWRD